MPALVLRLGGIATVSRNNGEFSFPSVLIGHYYPSIDQGADMSGKLAVQAMPMPVQVEADGLGSLNYEARRGMYLHPTYAVTPDRKPLGVLDAWMWAREMRDADGARHGQRESARWIEGYERVAEIAANMADTRLVYDADREADLVAIMAVRANWTH